MKGTTIEKIKEAISTEDGVVVRYGTSLLVADSIASDTFFASVFALSEDGGLTLIVESDELFSDVGHAIEWAIGIAKKL